MKGLVAYADDSEDEQMKEPMSNDVPLKTTANNSEPRKKPQVIIKRGPRKSRTTRAHVSEDIVEPLIREPPVASTSSEPMTGSATPPQEDELFHIRKLLRPPPLPGVDDWGIPPAPTTPCDPALQAKLAQFQALKSDPDNPRHFNDSLMSNRSFRNPHLYAKLVEFVDVDERATNFPKDLWNPDDLNPEWYADKIAEVQKTRYEQQSSGKGNGKRTIDFTSSKAKAKEPQKDGTRYNPYGSHHYPQGSQKKGRW